MNIFNVLYVLCFGFTLLSSKEVKFATSLGQTMESFDETSKIEDIINNIQEICVLDNSPQTVKELKENIQHILNGFEVYREIVELRKKLRNEIQWVIEESKDDKEVDEGIHLLKRGLIDKCSLPNLLDCSDKRKYNSGSGVVNIAASASLQGKKAFCDMTTDGGGWMVIQKRFDGSVNFERGWTEYERGFGDVNGEYWIGNQFIHHVTSGARYKLRIDLWDTFDAHTHAEYTTFVVGDAASRYKLTIGGYSGTAGDGLSYSNGMKFTTIDQDNDMWSSNCAVQNNEGAWWSKDCSYSSLNRKYTTKLDWLHTHTHLKSVMMIKRM